MTSSKLEGERELEQVTDKTLIIEDIMKGELNLI